MGAFFEQDPFGKQAAIRAGYSVRTAEVQASILLRYPKVSAAVAELGKEQADKLEDHLRGRPPAGLSDGFRGRAQAR